MITSIPAATTHSLQTSSPEHTQVESQGEGKSAAAVAVKTDNSAATPATVVTLSNDAKSAQAQEKPIRDPKYNILYNFSEEFDRDPMQALIRERSLFLELDKAYLAKLEGGYQPVNLLTGKQVTDPAIIAKVREGTLERIAEGEKALKNYLVLAAGGDPAADGAKAAEAAGKTDPALSDPQVAPELPSPAVQPLRAKTVVPLVSKDNATASAALLIELLAKGNEAYRGAQKL